MLPQTPKPIPATAPITTAQHLEVLLEHTGDLDKAEALKASIPQWLATADLKVVQALKIAFEQLFMAQDMARTALEKLKPLDEFCKEQLTTFLKGKWTIDFDVERDTLDIITPLYSSPSPIPLGYKVSETTVSRSLLHAAMENFTAEEAKSGGFSAESVIRIDAKAAADTRVTPEGFAAFCRELDLGGRYQRHISEVLALPVNPVRSRAVDHKANAADIRRLKVLDMQVALHMACLKKYITPGVYAMLLSVLEQDVPAARTRNALFDGGPVFWQGLMIDDACICGALVFTKVSIDIQPKARCVVYMPNEPRRPIFEYASLDEFRAYLTLHLQSTSYRKTFAGQYLQGHDKTDFFTRFDKNKTLGTFTAGPADTCIADFLFSAFVSTTQADARILAVPTEGVDEQQREKTLQVLLSGGLLLLNAASFFVPVIGQLMLLAAVVDIVSEVYEGVVDWTHGERAEALSHLLNVVENLAQMAVFAAGGKIISTAISTSVKEQQAFFDGFESVTCADGKSRLWKPDLEPYKQVTTLPADLPSNSQGIYQHAGQTSIVMDGAPYRVIRKGAGAPWTINHPLRSEAFQPAVERNVNGGWKLVHEQAHEWHSGAYALERMDPLLGEVGSDLESIADIADITPDKVHSLHERNLKLPARLSDCVERFKIDRRIREMVAAMEQGDTANTEFVQEQLHTLPGLPGWPTERFIAVVDEEEAIVSLFPETAPIEDEVNCVHVSQAQLEAGQLLDTVIDGLTPNEVEGLIGSTTLESKSQRLAKTIATRLKSNRQPLFEWLYKTHDGAATGDLATLREHAAGLPTRVCKELLDNASGRDRSFLHDRKILGSDLARQVGQAQTVLRQDRAVTGLHLPQLANADTDKLALGLMDRVQGWNDGYRLELRQGSVSGTLLDSIGEADARWRGVIVKMPTGYQVIRTHGNVSSTLTSETLLESILDALSSTQRTQMGLTGEDALDLPMLRSRLVKAAAGDPTHVARVLQGERLLTPKHLMACVQADSPTTGSYSRGLIRKVRRLYPLLTEAQVSSFLDEAGSTLMQRVNRIRELEQQLKKLRQLLHAWRDDTSQMATVPGRVNDVRRNRRQVVNAIENSWRRVEPTRLPHDQPFTTLKLERNPAGPLPALTEQDVAHVRHLSLKDMDAGDELAYFLRPFKGVTRLELDGNKLTRLPEALSYMPNLEHLSLNDNQLVLTQYTLRKLADMRGLRTLSLSGNRLGATIDVSKMFDLQGLFLRDTHATELPLGLSRLPYLDMVDLRGNDIANLPEWLFRMPRRFSESINLRHNPLSTQSAAKLKAYRDSTGLGMGYHENDAAVINEQMARELWMPDSREQGYDGRNRAWIALKNEPASDGFFRLLAEAGSTADSRYVREDMIRRVWDVIDATGKDPALRDQLLSMAVKSNCADSAATIFSHLEVAVEIDKVVRQSANAHDRAARLLKLGRSLFKLDYLATVAREHIKNEPRLDPVEVELAYRTGLAERLDLIGQPRHMRYASLSGVKTSDLNTAYSRVVAAQHSPEFLTYLSGRTFWVDFLREHHAKQFADLTEPFHQRMETAFDNQAKLGDQYRQQVDGIMNEMQKAETDLLERLTQTALRAEESNSCFALD